MRKCFFTSDYFSPFDPKSSFNQKLPSLKPKVCFCDWQINVSMFSNVIRLQLSPKRQQMQQKYNLGTKLTYIWHKNEKKISPNFIFVFQPLCFRHICHALSKFASQIKLIQYVVGVSCYSQGPRVPSPGSWMSRSMSQGPSSGVSGSQVSGSQSLGPQGPRSQDPRSWVSGLRVPVHESRFSGPEFTLCSFLIQSDFNRVCA